VQNAVNVIVEWVKELILSIIQPIIEPIQKAIDGLISQIISLTTEIFGIPTGYSEGKWMIYQSQELSNSQKQQTWIDELYKLLFIVFTSIGIGIQIIGYTLGALNSAIPGVGLLVGAIVGGLIVTIFAVSFITAWSPPDKTKPTDFGTEGDPFWWTGVGECIQQI
jgi:hypothetical protein